MARFCNDVCSTSGATPGREHELAAARGFALTALAEVDVDPAGEPVGQVPFALAVAEQDQLGHCVSYLVMPKRSRPNALIAFPRRNR